MKSLKQKISISIRGDICSKVYGFCNQNTIDKILEILVNRDTKYLLIKRQINREISKKYN